MAIKSEFIGKTEFTGLDAVRFFETFIKDKNENQKAKKLVQDAEKEASSLLKNLPFFIR